jgi:hypothetical protein
VLAGLEHDDQIGKLIGLILAHKSIQLVLGVIDLCKVLQDPEDNLGIDACHSKSLHKAAETVLDMIRSIVLPL